MREIQIMQSLKCHRNIIELLDVIVVAQNCVCLVREIERTNAVVFVAADIVCV